jgi:hypothetical protein
VSTGSSSGARDGSGQRGRRPRPNGRPWLLPAIVIVAVAVLVVAIAASVANGSFL